MGRNNDDAKIRRISKLLELGGTMLAQHCDTCGSPLFRYQGQVLCPLCNIAEEGEEAQDEKVEETIPSVETEVSTGKKEEFEAENVESKAKVSSEQPDTHLHEPVSDALHAERKVAGSLEQLIESKLVEIAKNIQSETDPRRVEDAFDLIERGVTILERIRHNS
ncbi:Sjogren's syndrome/scleroderma autoantigen 1 family protein [Methanohalophilus mahii]|uniref:Sjogrens syndrome scleroderma autoantigen 1 n=1 Tax=Methanohalophilus mahii (strain ATCC 35705 / DSM 5219 / SLP) TaxID=547558 RepID=D5EAL2_METMS|nr:Sjogren's syndrome/scleroderma autoantigen 1 family protein [Methanohalophilus mahii]ADE36213.1 Sjogrens syndrome scleroderma autoantigen 1 [Methanohalophilus mahii DSM 5219]